MANNSFVVADDINEDNHALICHTDNSYCCGSGTDLKSKAHWKFPTQNRLVPDRSVTQCTSDKNCYFRSRGDGEVRLNRRGNPQEWGCFHCEIPDDDNVTVNLYVTICKCMDYWLSCSITAWCIIHPVDTTMVHIAPSGLQTPARLVGEIGFTMECTVTLPCDTDAATQPTFD